MFNARTRLPLRTPAADREHLVDQVSHHHQQHGIIVTSYLGGLIATSLTSHTPTLSQYLRRPLIY